MKRYPALFTCACLALCGQAASAQTPAAIPVEKEVVTLPTFTITETPANAYQSRQALSASRVAMDIQDIPQTISVVSGDFIADSMSFKMLDAAKYVTPVVESTLPFGGDRYMIRGFQVSQEFIDGSVISGGSGYSMSIPTYNIDRIEVLKGPNAILVPGGSPGGVMNPITKSPMAKDATSLTLNLAQYNGNDVGIDVNRVLNKDNHMAVRFIAGYWRNTNLYIKNHFRIGYEISPSFSVELSPTQKLVIKADFIQNRETNLGGVTVDPLIGSNQEAVIARGLPRDWSFGNDDDNDSCPGDCGAPYCGDGLVQYGVEECDDGGYSTASCTPFLMSLPMCACGPVSGDATPIFTVTISGAGGGVSALGAGGGSCLPQPARASRPASARPEASEVRRFMASPGGNLLLKNRLSWRCAGVSISGGPGKKKKA